MEEIDLGTIVVRPEDETAIVIGGEEGGQTVAGEEAFFGDSIVADKPILPLQPIEAFDWDTSVAHIGLEPTARLAESRFNFNTTAAEADGLSPYAIIESLKVNSENARVNLAKANAQAQDMDDWDLGIASLGTGVSQTMNKVLNSTYIREDEEYEKIKKTLTEFSTDLDRARVDPDFLSKFTGGKALAEIAALPMTTVGKMSTALVSAAIAGVGAYDKANTGEALEAAAWGGAFGYATAAFLRSLTGMKARDLNAKVRKKYLTTPEAVEKFNTYFKEYEQTVMLDTSRKVLSPESWLKAGDKHNLNTMGLINYLRKEGPTIKNTAAQESEVATRAMRESVQVRGDAFTTAIGNASHKDLPTAARALKDGMDNISTSYTNMLESLGVQKTSSNSNLLTDFTTEALDDLDDITRSSVKALYKMINEETTAGLMDAIKQVNHLIRSTGKNNNARAYNLTQLKGKIDNKLRQELLPVEYLNMKANSRDYSMMAQVRESTMNDIMQKVLNKEITSEQGLTSLFNMSSGEKMFSELEQVIGTAQTAKIEKLMVTEALKNHDLSTWSLLSDSIDGKGFITPEGKGLREMVQRFGRLFRIDDTTNLGIGLPDVTSSGSKSEFNNQVRGAFMSRLWMSMLKHVPFTETKAQNINMNHFIDVLKTPTKLKKFLDDAEAIPEVMRNKMLQEVVEDMSNRTNVPKAPVTMLSEPNTVYTNYLKTSTIADGLDEAYKIPALQSYSKVDKNNITESAFKHFDKTRFTDRLHAVTKSMKPGEVDLNAARLQKVLDNEAKMLSKAIQKDHGLTVGKARTDALLKSILKYGLEDCD